MRRLLAGLIAVTLAASTTARAQSPQSTAQPPQLTDSQIAAILDAANNYDIETGSLAAKKAVNKDVRAYGAMIARDHRILLANTRRLAERQALVSKLPADWEGKEAHTEAMRTLENTRGAEFDRAFLEHEADYHQGMIDAVTNTLLPAIHNGELKSFVQQAGPAFVAHRDAANRLLAQLDSARAKAAAPKAATKPAPSPKGTGKPDKQP